MYRWHLKTSTFPITWDSKSKWLATFPHQCCQSPAVGQVLHWWWVVRHSPLPLLHHPARCPALREQWPHEVTPPLDSYITLGLKRVHLQNTNVHTGSLFSRQVDGGLDAVGGGKTIWVLSAKLVGRGGDAKSWARVGNCRAPHSLYETLQHVSLLDLPYIIKA